MYKWTGRTDEGVLAGRFHEIIKPSNLNTTQIKNAAKYLLGFACDEGVLRNQGRVGAKAGPIAIRQALSNLCVPESYCEIFSPILDAGNVNCSDGNLELAQKLLAEKVDRIIQSESMSIVLGGGHETAWGHFQGFASLLKFGCKIGVVNLDAHFDLRPLNQIGQGTSGTPFLQIHNWCKANNFHFDYTVLGIQPRSNDYNLFKTAQKLQIKYVTAEQIFIEPGLALKKLNRIIERNDKIYLSLCLDVFNSAFAPGVSAPSAQGLCPWHINPIIKIVKDSHKLIAFDVVELNPLFDRDNQTAKLAASYVAELIF